MQELLAAAKLTKRTRIAIASVVVVLMIAGVSAWLARSRLPSIDPEDPAQLMIGGRVYAENCAGCHGKALEGEPGWPNRKPDGRMPAPPQNASGHAWIYEDKELFERIRHGMRDTDMPAFEDRLSDTEIAAVLAFIESTWPADVRAHQERLSR